MKKYSAQMRNVEYSVCMQDCIFCKISNKTAPARIIYEDDLVIAFLDIHPISDGHTLIIPKKHIPTIHELDDETGSRIMRVAKMMAGVIENSFPSDGSMIMEVNGEFQDVPHFHMHVFGRSKANDITFSYPKETNFTDEHLDRVANKLTEEVGS